MTVVMMCAFGDEELGIIVPCELKASCTVIIYDQRTWPPVRLPACEAHAVSYLEVAPNGSSFSFSVTLEAPEPEVIPE